MACNKLTVKTNSPMKISGQYFELDGTTPKALPDNIDFDVIHPTTGAVLANLSVGSGITKPTASTFNILHSDTSDWPLVEIPADLMLDKGETDQSPTETFILDVQRGYTT